MILHCPLQRSSGFVVRLKEGSDLKGFQGHPELENVSFKKSCDLLINWMLEVLVLDVRHTDQGYQSVWVLRMWNVGKDGL